MSKDCLPRAIKATYGKSAHPGNMLRGGGYQVTMVIEYETDIRRLQRPDKEGGG